MTLQVFQYSVVLGNQEDCLYSLCFVQVMIPYGLISIFLSSSEVVCENLRKQMRKSVNARHNSAEQLRLLQELVLVSLSCPLGASLRGFCIWFNSPNTLSPGISGNTRLLVMSRHPGSPATSDPKPLLCS